MDLNYLRYARKHDSNLEIETAQNEWLLIQDVYKEMPKSIWWLITSVWNFQNVKLMTVLNSSDPQLSYEHKKEVILCRNGWENHIWSFTIKIFFCYWNVTVTFWGTVMFPFISQTILVQISYPWTFVESWNPGLSFDTKHYGDTC